MDSEKICVNWTTKIERNTHLSDIQNLCYLACCSIYIDVLKIQLKNPERKEQKIWETLNCVAWPACPVWRDAVHTSVQPVHLPLSHVQEDMDTEKDRGARVVFSCGVAPKGMYPYSLYFYPSIYVRFGRRKKVYQGSIQGGKPWIDSTPRSSY